MDDTAWATFSLSLVETMCEARVLAGQLGRPLPGDSAQGWPLTGDHAQGRTLTGDSAQGRPLPGDNAQGWPLPGDHAQGWPLPGNSAQEGHARPMPPEHIVQALNCPNLCSGKCEEKRPGDFRFRAFSGLQSRVSRCTM
jgi:hypothetical protein